MPRDANLLEHTPCSEILQKRSSYVEFMDAPSAATAAAALAIIPLAAAANASPPAAASPLLLLSRLLLLHISFLNRQIKKRFDGKTDAVYLCIHCPQLSLTLSRPR